MIKYSCNHKLQALQRRVTTQVWALATQSFVFLTENKGDNFSSFVRSKQNKIHKGVVEARIRKYVLL